MRHLLDDPASENTLRFCLNIKTANYMVPCIVGDIKAEGGYRMAVLISCEGERFLPAFTCTAELSKWKFERDKIALYSFDELKTFVLDNPQRLSGIAIDPYGSSLMLKQEHIKQIDAELEGMSVYKSEYNNLCHLSSPQKVPAGLEDELNAFFKNRPEVYRAYLLSAQERKEEEAYLLLLIDFDGKKNALFPSAAKVVSSYIKQGEPFEIVKATYDLLHKAASLCQAVYIKSE